MKRYLLAAASVSAFLLARALAGVESQPWFTLHDIGSWGMFVVRYGSLVGIVALCAAGIVALARVFK